MDKRSLVTLCKYLYDRDRYVAFSSMGKYKIFLRKINKAVEEIYLETLNELLIFYGTGFAVVLFVCVISLLSV